MRGMEDRKTSPDLRPPAPPHPTPLSKKRGRSLGPCNCARGSRAAKEEDEDEKSLSQNVTAAPRLFYFFFFLLLSFSPHATHEALLLATDVQRLEVFQLGQNFFFLSFFLGGGLFLAPPPPPHLPHSPVCSQVMSLSILCITER